MIPAAHSRAFEAIFGWYTANLIKRRFAGVHVRGDLPPRDVSLIVASQHVAWWDPMLLWHMSRTHYEATRYFAMMDEKNLKAYPFFRWIGAFGVSLKSPRESVAAVKYTLDILEKPGTRVLIFPQGRQQSMDARPLTGAGGASYVASKSRVSVLPVALRYEFLEEEKPEIFVSVGPTFRVEKAPGKGEPDPILAAVTRVADEMREDVYARKLGDFVALK